MIPVRLSNRSEYILVHLLYASVPQVTKVLSVPPSRKEGRERTFEPLSEETIQCSKVSLALNLNSNRNLQKEHQKFTTRSAPLNLGRKTSKASEEMENSPSYRVLV